MIKSVTVIFSALFKGADIGKDLSRDKNCLPIGRYRNIPLSLIPYSFSQSFPSSFSRTIQRREVSFLACSHDYRMKVWIRRGQMWPLITVRTWLRSKEDSLHFHPGLFTSFLRKDSESIHFLSEHLICSNQHPGDRKFHHLLQMCITCVSRKSWLELQRSKCLFLITGIKRIFVGFQSGPRSRHAQTQFMVIPQNCELRRFLFIEPKWVSGRVSKMLLTSHFSASVFLWRAKLTTLPSQHIQQD